MAKRRVTSADVARLSGVSQATVSYVMNANPRQSITPETRARVLNAAATLGYEPSAAARTLRSGTSRLILVVVQFAQIDPKNAQTLNRLEQDLSAHGYNLVWYVSALTAPVEPHPSLNLSPAVVLSFGDSSAETERFLSRFGVPVVSLGTGSRRSVVGRCQVKYLSERGASNLAFAAPERPDLQSYALSHLAGVREACAQRGLEPPAVLTLPASREGSRDALVRFLEGKNRSLGFCCYNDEVAFAALAGLADLGVVVPHEAAVIGCDDIPLAQLSQPPLTTVTFSGEHSRAQMLETILAAAEGKSAPPLDDLEPTVIIRASA